MAARDYGQYDGVTRGPDSEGERGGQDVDAGGRDQTVITAAGHAVVTVREAALHLTATST